MWVRPCDTATAEQGELELAPKLVTDPELAGCVYMCNA